MRFEDLTHAAFRTLQSTSTGGPDCADHDEAHRLRGRILGVLMRQARLAAERTGEDCARYLSVDAETIEAWELGISVPSLPHLEMLAGFFKLPIADETENASDPLPPGNDEYWRLRQRIVGALLQSGRKAQDLSAEDLSAKTGLDAKLLGKYEYGEAAIPVHHLTILAEAVHLDLSYFADAKGINRQNMSSTAHEASPATDEDADLVEFAADRRNRAFIRLAMAFRDIDREELDRIASALSAIIGERRVVNGQSQT